MRDLCIKRNKAAALRLGQALLNGSGVAILDVVWVAEATVIRVSGPDSSVAAFESAVKPFRAENPPKARF